MGAFGSLLMATTVSAPAMPAACWMAPEMPQAMYSLGPTVLPVWPIWCAGAASPRRRGNVCSRRWRRGRREVADDLEPFRGTDTAAAGDDDLRAFEVDGLIADLVDDFDDLRADIFSATWTSSRMMVACPSTGSLLEHAGRTVPIWGRCSGHWICAIRLPPMADGSEDVAGLFIDVELGAVCGQAGPEPAGRCGGRGPARWAWRR